MWWKRFVIGFSPKLLGFILPVLILVAMVGYRQAEAAGEPDGLALLAAMSHTANDVFPKAIDADQATTSDGNGTSSADTSNQGATTSQLDDAASVPSAPAPQDAPPAPKRVGIQAGHWRSAELPDELARLRTSTGTAGGGVAEWQLNLDIANRIAALLEAQGVTVDLLPATVPPGYQADAFVALHADGDTSGRLSGFKLARPRMSSMPEAEDVLLNAITDEYQAATHLSIDPNISRNMTGYYAFSFRRFEHAVAPTTPAVILEMGFLTNASDRRILLGTPDTVANGIARGILRFLSVERQ